MVEDIKRRDRFDERGGSFYWYIDMIRATVFAGTERYGEL